MKTPDGVEIRHAVCPVCGRRGVLVNGRCSPLKRRIPQNTGATYCERVEAKKARR